MPAAIIILCINAECVSASKKNPRAEKDYPVQRMRCVPSTNSCHVLHIEPTQKCEINNGPQPIAVSFTFKHFLSNYVELKENKEFSNACNPL